MKIQIINGPNLNLLGTREPDIYGNTSFDEYLKKLQSSFPSITLDYYQSNSEGDIVDKLHQTGFDYNGIIINAGAYTHTSLAIADAIASIETPVIEVHVSNVYTREAFRHHSFLARSCVGVIAGFGLESYRLGLEFFTKH